MNFARGLLIVAWASSPLVVGQAEEINLGMAPSNPAKAGFTMNVLSQRLGNEGFQPIKLRFRAIGKSFNAERRLTLLFRPRTQYRTNIDFQFSCNVTVPQGVKTYDTDILVPHFYRWETCSVRVIEDGKQWGKTATYLNMPVSVKDWGQYISIGVIEPSAGSKTGAAWETFPDLRSILTVLGNGPINNQVDVGRLNDKQARRFVERLRSGWARFRLFDEETLQASWVGYSQLDLILVPYPVLARVSAEQPEQLDALQKWVCAGGQIWTYAAPLQPDPSDIGWLSGKREDFRKSIRYVAKPKLGMQLSQMNDNSPVEYQPWNYGSYSTNNYSYDSSANQRQDVYDKLVDAKNPMVEVQTSKEMQSRVSAMPYGLGRVVFLGDEDPFPGSFQLWKSLETDRQYWDQRQGVDFSNGNDNYWAWLMAAVGQPPVSMFVVLNGLFVLVMGPVLYFGLRRRSRLYLLYFLAPTLAFLATMGLFAYAFISDGFGNRVRVRQLTWVDGQKPLSTDVSIESQRFPVFDQSRQTYYTVIDSNRGLRFDDETFVLPVHHSEIMDQYSYYVADHNRSGDYSIADTGDARVYAGDFLPTRTQVHYLVNRPGFTEFPVEVDFSVSPPTFTNRTGQGVRRASVCDQNGKYWTTYGVAPGKTKQLEPSDAVQFTMLVAQYIEPDTDSMPEPFQNRTSLTDQTALEERFSEFCNRPQPNSFVAVTEIDESVVALRDCVQEQCIRLIGGMLP